MPWKPVDPFKGKRERQRRRAMEMARPKNHNRAYKNAAWLTLRKLKISADSQCIFCQAASATEVDHINGDPWDNRWDNLRSLCKACHSSRTMRDLNKRLRLSRQTITCNGHHLVGRDPASSSD